MRMRVLLILLVIGLLPALPAQAWWGEKETQDSEKTAVAESKSGTRRYHLNIPDKATEKELLDLFRARRFLDEDVRVLTRLTEHRKKRSASLDKNLKEEFSILPEIRYEYDSDKMIIYKLESESDKSARDKNKSGTKANKSVKRVQPSKKRSLHMKLKNEAEVRRFLGLNGSKSRTGQEIQVFQSTMREHQNKLKKVNDLLANKFELKSGRFYDYDEKTMSLYEITRPQQKSPPK